MSTYNQIYDHLIKCNKSFVPHLSSYVDIEAYSMKISTKAKCFISYCEHNEDMIIGLIAGYMNESSMFITNVSVDPDYTNQGIGKTLLDECESFCKSNNIDVIRLEVKPENEKAIQFYLKNNFNKKDEITYEKELR